MFTRIDPRRATIEGLQTYSPWINGTQRVSALAIPSAVRSCVLCGSNLKLPVAHVLVKAVLISLPVRLARLTCSNLFPGYDDLPKLAMDHITTHYCSLQPGLGQSISRPQAEERSVAMDAVEGLTSLDELADDSHLLRKITIRSDRCWIGRNPGFSTSVAVYSNSMLSAYHSFNFSSSKAINL